LRLRVFPERRRSTLAREAGRIC